MNGSANDIESHIDLFLEHVKRSAARAMEDRGNDGWLSNENLVHSIIKRSRSGMSSSDDGTVQLSAARLYKTIRLDCDRTHQTYKPVKMTLVLKAGWDDSEHGKQRMMEVNENDKAAGEILRSLLSTPKMESSQQEEANNWQELESNYHPQEQIVWQIESPKGSKDFVTDNLNVFQHIPVTYVTADAQNFTFANAGTDVKPVTYVLSRNVIAETPNYCVMNGGGGSEPPKIVFVQQVDSEPVYDEVEAKVLTISSVEQAQYLSTNDAAIMTVKSVAEPGQDKGADKKLKADSAFNAVKKPESKGRTENGEEATLAKPKVERKISKNKKLLNKWKNSKLKTKLKQGGKGLCKKPKITFKSVEYEKDEEKMDGRKEMRNLFELTKLEDNVDQVIERFKIGCECSESNCFDGLNPDSVFKHRLNIADLTKEEHDMFLMGVIMASFQNLQETCRHKERIRIRSCYAYQGKKVCLTAFLYLQHVTLYQMKRLRSHLKNHGVSPRIHGNRGRKPANTFPLDIYRHATSFVQGYIEKHCVKAVPAFSSNKIGNSPLLGERKSGKKPNMAKVANKLTSYHLPPECTKKTVHQEYKSFCENVKPSQKAMKYSTFTHFLKKQFPNVKFQKDKR